LTFFELSGRRRDEVLGRPFGDLVGEQDVASIIGFHALFAAEQTRDNHVLFVTSDGQNRMLAVSTARSKDTGNTVLTARAIGRVQLELAETTRWAASEQTRADVIARARDELAETNAALLKTQEELKAAYVKLEQETAARLKLEGELHLSQKLESVGQLAAGIAHEINTPTQFVSDSIHFIHEGFSDISGLCDLYREMAATVASVDSDIQRRIADAERTSDLEFLLQQIPKSFTRCFDGIERIASIVRAMKEFAHPDTREKSYADINRAILNTLTICHNEYKYVADVQTDFAELPQVPCHVGDLNQVFLNLTVNAAHAIASVVGDSGARGKLTIRTSLEQDFVRIEFEDTGCGIPESIRDRVFEPFFTTKEVGRGSGQGLAIARNIVVEKHGGGLAFESTPGRGTTFTIRLPLIAGTQAQTFPTSYRAPP
jgi:signal transduction histidine kinase